LAINADDIILTQAMSSQITFSHMSSSAD